MTIPKTFPQETRLTDQLGGAKKEKKGEKKGGGGSKKGTRLQLQLPRNTSSALLPEAAVSSAGSGRRWAQSRGRGSPRRGPSSLSRLCRRGVSRVRGSAGQSRSPTDTSARRAGSHPLPSSPPNRSPASRSAPPRLTLASPTQQVPAAASCSPAPQPRGAGGRAEGTLGRREEKKASPPVGDLCRDFSPRPHHPRRPPQCRRGRSHAAAAQALAHGPRQCRVPPRILPPPRRTGAASRRRPWFRCAFARSKVRKTPGSPSASRRAAAFSARFLQSLYPGFSPAARPKSSSCHLLIFRGRR